MCSPPCFTHLPRNSPHWAMFPPTLLCPGRFIFATWNCLLKGASPSGARLWVATVSGMSPRA